MSSPRITHRLPELACLVLIVLALVAGAPAPARAGDDPEATTTTPDATTTTPEATTTTAFDDGDQRIIPRPNSGHEPTEAGDRGGALQIAVLGLILVGVGFVGWKVRSALDLPEGSGRSKTEERS